MKRIIALLLVLALSISVPLMLTACDGETGEPEEEEKEKKKSHYVVISQENYFNGELQRSADFAYDEKGRPTVLSLNLKADETLQIELTYDDQGNLIRELANHNGQVTADHQYQLTYQGDRIVSCRWLDQERFRANIRLTYDDKGNLVFLDYEGSNRGGMPLWHSYVYDEENRLIQETRCSNMDGGGYRYDRVNYAYDSGSLSVFTQWVQISRRLDMDQLTEIKLHDGADPFTCFYDGEGRILGCAPTLEGTWDPNDTVYDQEHLNFDEDGNLTHIRDSGGDEGSGTDFSYKALMLTAQEAEMSRRLCHVVSSAVQPYAVFGCMDPIFFQAASPMLYIPYLWGPLSYLIPYPMW